MKERPILFSGPMVKAIIEGRKTQTRRIVKMPEGYELDAFEPTSNAVLCSRPGEHPRSYQIPCRYGRAGDQLWVRESWAIVGNEDGHYVDASGNLVSRPEDAKRIYRADCSPGEYGADVLPDGSQWFSKWKPSIHMPRWASRITLEVVNVRVQRVQDITEADAKAEGMPLSFDFAPRLQFAMLWDEINGDRAPWSANPLVWVVEFKRAS